MPSPDKADEAVLVTPSFHDWLSKHGVVAHCIQAAYVEEGWRGICATQDIPAGTRKLYDTHCFTAGVLRDAVQSSDPFLAGAMLLQVPEKALMSTSSARRNHDFAKHFKQSQALSPEQASLSGMLHVQTSCLKLRVSLMQVLIAHLLHEASQGSSSPWHPYIAQLPHQYSLLMGFSPEHIQALQVTHTMQLAVEICDQNQQQWAQARPFLQTLGMLAFFWERQQLCC